MVDQRSNKKRVHKDPKLKTRMTGWSIPVWMVEQIEQKARDQNVSASKIVRDFIAKELDYTLVTHNADFRQQKKSGRPQLFTDPARKNHLAGWSMPARIIDYVNQEAEEAGEFPSRIALQLIEEALQHRFENSQSSHINNSVAVGV